MCSRPLSRCNRNSFLLFFWQVLLCCINCINDQLRAAAVEVFWLQLHLTSRASDICSFSRSVPHTIVLCSTTYFSVCQPAPASEHAFHLRQQHTPKEKLLSQDRIEIAFTTNRAKNHQAPTSRSRLSCDSKNAPRLYPGGSAKKGKSETHRPST